jgi:hypothetical protein
LKTRSILITSILLTLLLLAGCSSKPKLGDAEIYLGGEVKEKDDKILIDGKSNLKQGARVVGKVIVGENEVLSDSTEVVEKDGSFSMELDHHKYGEAEVVVTFDFTSMQDEAIVEQYGEGGIDMKGPYVYMDEHWNELIQKAEVRLTLSPEDESDTHAFTEPEWQERPEDYGDPRVWIEVDEVTTDDDYFYLKGKTNLLEGSQISGYYSDRWHESDKTRIKPDGTFELKFEYWYSEDDPSFTVKFEPYSQWHTIEEAYGRNGEKLVGNLVEKSGSSQLIKKFVEYEHE